jgi:hypothetical protein
MAETHQPVVSAGVTGLVRLRLWLSTPRGSEREGGAFHSNFSPKFNMVCISTKNFQIVKNVIYFSFSIDWLYCFDNFLAFLISQHQYLPF